MNRTEILHVANFHCSFLAHTGIVPARAHHDLFAPTYEQALAHALWLLHEVPQLVQEGRAKKATRWTCFVQGVLWDRGLTTTHVLKDLLRPDGTPFDPAV